MLITVDFAGSSSFSLIPPGYNRTSANIISLCHLFVGLLGDIHSSGNIHIEYLPKKGIVNRLTAALILPQHLKQILSIVDHESY